jgi:hypothetical protein
MSRKITLKYFAQGVFLFSFFILSSCGSTQSKKTPVKSTGYPQKEEIIVEESGSAGGSYTEAPSTILHELPPQSANRVRTASVWIEAIGTDAFLALGFLQELEKKVKIVSVNGVGFGCWIALSWAAENKGSYAEWQSFKWDSWDLLGANILNRVIGRSSPSSFKARLAGKLPLKNKDRFKIPMNCPYIAKGRLAFEDPSSMDIYEELWVQMRNVFFFPAAELERDTKKSGLYRRAVTSDELLKFTSGSVEPREHLWIVLSSEVLRKELRRPPQAETQKGLIDDFRWVRKTIAADTYRNVSDAKDLTKKRPMLLRGRKEGKLFFEDPSMNKFLGF